MFGGAAWSAPYSWVLEVEPEKDRVEEAGETTKIQQWWDSECFQKDPLRGQMEGFSLN